VEQSESVFDLEAVSDVKTCSARRILLWDTKLMSDERPTEMVRLRDVLDNHQGELERLLEERTRLDERILQLENKIRHVARMVDTVDDPITQLGLTDAIRYVIPASWQADDPVHVRDELLQAVLRFRRLQEPPRLGAHRHETFDVPERSWSTVPKRNGREDSPCPPLVLSPIESKLSKESLIPVGTLFFSLASS
jgi:hypothetical protein